MTQDTGQQTPDFVSQLSQAIAEPANENMGTHSLSDPFSNANNAFYSGADRGILLDEVIHLCQFGNNLVAVLGEEGVGKTTLLTQARYELAETAFCCFINATVMMSAEDIFTQIISQLELPVAPTSSIGEMIAILRHAMAEGNLHRVVIIIDDAHQLSDQILSALVSLLQGHQGQHHLHLLVGGDSSIADRLDQFEMVDVLVYDINLNPLIEQEVQEYIGFKLATAGYQDSSVVSPKQINSIWQDSAGIPARINQLAQALLFQQDLGEPEESDRQPGLPLLHMSLLVVLLAALILALFYMGSGEPDGDSLSGSTEEGLAPPTIAINNEPVTTKAEGENVQSKEAVASSPEQPTATALPQPSAGQASEDKPEALSQAAPVPTDEKISAEVNQSALKEKKTPKLTAPNTQAETSSAVSVINSDLQKELKAEALSLSGGSNAAPVIPTTTPAVNAPKPKVNSSAPSVSSQEAKAIKGKLVKEKQPAQDQEAVPSSVAPVKTKNLTEDEKVVMAWPEGEYTLPVMAAGQPDGLKKFIAAQPNKEQLKLVQIQRSGKPWFVVLTGVYDDGDLARKAIQLLPQAQVNAGPWIRKINDVKREIGDVSAR